MKKTLILIALLAMVAAYGSSQSNLLMVSGGYFEQHNSYDWKTGALNTGGLPLQDFTDTWHSFGIGTTQYVGVDRPVGFYSNSYLVIPISLMRETTSETDYDVKDFHFGIDSLGGVGKHFEWDRMGLLLGGGLHLSWNLFWTYPGSDESRFNFIDIGAGGGAHLYVMVNESTAIHAGTVWWYDFAQLRWSSGNSISDDYYSEGGWGYQVTAGVTLRFDTAPAARR